MIKENIAGNIYVLTGDYFGLNLELLEQFKEILWSDDITTVTDRSNYPRISGPFYDYAISIREDVSTKTFEEMERTVYHILLGQYMDYIMDYYERKDLERLGLSLYEYAHMSEKERYNWELHGDSLIAAAIAEAYEEDLNAEIDNYALETK